MNLGPTSTRLDGRGIGGGAIAVIALLALVYIGSEGLRWFDAALAPYLFGTLLAAFATVYRYTVWLRRPPTARLNRRGWEALRSTDRLGSNLLALGGMLVTNLALQRFIASRSRTRWLAHQLLFWGRGPFVFPSLGPTAFLFFYTPTTRPHLATRSSAISSEQLPGTSPWCCSRSPRRHRRSRPG